ncbi:MAG: carbon starvation CstA family protein, partial [Phycisphaerae bacterium]
GAIILAVLVPDLQLRFRPFTVAGYTISPVVTWTVILLIYCYFASIVPVWQLLQPRDYINSFILLLCLGLLVAGVAAATLLTPGGARLVAPAVRASPAGAPPIIPFLFVTVACGAISGFHCLVSSGTSSKQIASEPDAQFVAYGSMLTEGFLAVLVILACCAGLGLGSKYTGSWRAELNGSQQVLLLSDADGLEHRIIRQADTGQILTVDGQTVPPRALPQSYDLAGGSLIVEPDNDLLITGRLAWMNHYRAWGTAKGLGAKLGAFIHGGANLASSLGIPIDIAVAIVAVMVTCFAATTLDTATRLERYVIQELASTARIRPLQGKHAATLLAVGTAGALAIAPPPGLTWAAGMGKGGLTLWPIFGAVNQLLAGLAFLVIVFHLLRRRKPLWFIATPAALMLLVPITAMLMQIFRSGGWWRQGQWHLVTVGLAVCALQLWMVGEALRLWPKIRGILEPPLPPLRRPTPTASSFIARKETAG